MALENNFFSAWITIYRGITLYHPKLDEKFFYCFLKYKVTIHDSVGGMMYVKVYTRKIYSGIPGKIVGVYVGRPFEVGIIVK